MIMSGHMLREIRPVEPFHERTCHNGLTFGVGPAGYDVRIDQDILLEPGGFALASTMEYFTMPKDLLGIVHDKSTWARLGLAAQNTVIEPGWHGFLTLELTNHNPRPGWLRRWRKRPPGTIVIQRGTAIVQVVFHRLDTASEGYAGKYQGQKRGPQPAILGADGPRFRPRN